MFTIKEAQDYKEYLVNDYYKTLRDEQLKDDAFYKDTFQVPQIKDPARLSRTGRGARMVDSPAEHIITRNPQVFRLAKKKGDIEKSNRITAMFNEIWIPMLKRQNPNPFKESAKNGNLRGDGFLHVIHKEGWKTDDPGFPVRLLTPEPMVIYPDPVEDEFGVPKRVIVCYRHNKRIVHEIFPDWKSDSKEEVVEYWEYWDKDMRYFEADGKPLLSEGAQKNIYGFVPFVHFLSGFGKSSPSGDPAELVVGILRKRRDPLIRECAITSSIDSIIFLLGQPQKDFMITESGLEPSDTLIDDYKVGFGRANVLPYGVKPVEAEVSQPSPEMFAHLANIRGELEREDPAVLAGLPVGGSGRQQDMVAISAMRRFDTVVENIEQAFTTAFGMALRIMELPGFRPNELHIDDIDKDYDLIVKLNAAHPIEDDRKATLGSRLWREGEIDLETNLVEYQGKTTERAREIMAKILVDNATRNNPVIAEMMGRQLAQEIGAEDAYEAIKAEAKMAEKGMSPTPQTGIRGGEPRVGNIQTERGFEEADLSLAGRGARSAPYG